MITEMTSALLETGMMERQTVLRERARREAAGLAVERERRHFLRRIVRHSS